MGTCISDGVKSVRHQTARTSEACNEAKVSSRFTRIIQRKDLPWEKDSIARVANDPEHIPDCNVQATVGQHFIFSEPIPKAGNGRGYLRVTKKSLWWQTAQFPTVWTSEGLTTCMETGYQFTVNSTRWNHLRMLWQAPPLDLLSLVYQETHVQNILEASGYRTPTWRILRALQSTINANVVQRIRRDITSTSKKTQTGSYGVKPNRKT